MGQNDPVRLRHRVLRWILWGSVILVVLGLFYQLGQHS
jgi:hypothetical protein